MISRPVLPDEVYDSEMGVVTALEGKTIGDHDAEKGVHGKRWKEEEDELRVV